MSREMGYYELKLMMMNEKKVMTEISYTKGLPKLRNRNYRKVTGSELRSMISEDCGSAHASEVEELPAMLPPDSAAPPMDIDPGMVPDSSGRNLGSGGKSRMSRQQLHHIAEYAVELWNLLDDEDEIPEWCQSKIAVMTDAIGKVKHHLEYKIEEPVNLSLNGGRGDE
jgi:hypothetical protein